MMFFHAGTLYIIYVYCVNTTSYFRIHFQKINSKNHITKLFKYRDIHFYTTYALIRITNLFQNHEFSIWNSISIAKNYSPFVLIGTFNEIKNQIINQEINDKTIDSILHRVLLELFIIFILFEVSSYVKHSNDTFIDP